MAKELLKEYNKQIKETESMADFNFGPFATSDVRLSLYGMAIKNKSGKWISYDKENHRLMDVEIFSIGIDSSKLLYKLPKAINEVAPGDIILHNNKPVFVEMVREDGKFEVIDPVEGTAITILPAVSPFGFNFVTQIVSLADYLPAATPDNPFGNLLPFILGSENNTGLMMMMMFNKNEDIDPMMLALMCGNDSKINPFLLMKLFEKKNKEVK